MPAIQIPQVDAGGYIPYPSTGNQQGGNNPLSAYSDMLKTKADLINTAKMYDIKGKELAFNQQKQLQDLEQAKKKQEYDKSLAQFDAIRSLVDASIKDNDQPRLDNIIKSLKSSALMQDSNFGELYGAISNIKIGDEGEFVTEIDMPNGFKKIIKQDSKRIDPATNKPAIISIDYKDVSGKTGDTGSGGTNKADLIEAVNPKTNKTEYYNIKSNAWTGLIPAGGTGGTGGQMDKKTQNLIAVSEQAYNKALDMIAPVDKKTGERNTTTSAYRDVVGRATGRGKGGKLETEVLGAVNSLVYALSGKNVTEQERQGFIRAYAPEALNSPEIAKYKLEALGEVIRMIKDGSDDATVSNKVNEIINYDKNNTVPTNSNQNQSTYERLKNKNTTNVEGYVVTVKNK